MGLRDETQKSTRTLAGWLAGLHTFGRARKAFIIVGEQPEGGARATNDNNTRRAADDDDDCVGAQHTLLFPYLKLGDAGKRQVAPNGICVCKSCREQRRENVRRLSSGGGATLNNNYCYCRKICGEIFKSKQDGTSQSSLHNDGDDDDSGAPRPAQVVAQSHLHARTSL